MQRSVGRSQRSVRPEGGLTAGNVKAAKKQACSLRLAPFLGFCNVPSPLLKYNIAFLGFFLGPFEV